MDLRANILNIFVVVFIILALILLIDLLGIDLSEPPVKKQLAQVVTIEGLEKLLKMNPADDFCAKSSKSSCEKLTNKNCNKTSCCVLLNGNQCVSGAEDGPTFKTSNGEKVNVDYYYYQDKCFGDKCPSI